MFSTIYVPLDNSPHSTACIDFALALARETGASVVGSHVFAAKMHDVRFKQMEFALPEQYQEEAELERQREVHDDLIGKGLRLISESYLDVLERRCSTEAVDFERKTFDGRNFQELVKDIAASNYDLVVMGAHGQGAVKGSLIGSVTERVMRRIQVDSLVVRDLRPWDEGEGDGKDGEGVRRPIVVALDGSPQSFHGLEVAIHLARQLRRPLKGVAVFDPYLHYSIFHSISEVLSEEASDVFRFQEQEKLHEEVIDTGLAKIYQSHLDVGRRLSEAEGVEMETSLLPGKPFERILEFVHGCDAWLLVCGRIGVHSEEDMDIGSNSENLLRTAQCNVLLASGRLVPPVDLRAEESVNWTEEAVERMQRAPSFVRGVARQAVLRWAAERGHSVITSGVIDRAIGGILPPGAAAAMGMAAKVAEQRTAEDSVYVCKNCGHVARREQPVTCVVCGAGGEDFAQLDRAAIESQARIEGDVEGETTFDGVKLFWTGEARRTLQIAPSGYQRRRARARVEKLAKVRKLSTITRELVMEIVDGEASGENPAVSSLERRDLSPDGAGRPPLEETPSEGPDEEWVRDGEFLWSAAAAARVQRVPEGFMRSLARENIEAFARQQGTDEITLELAEQGVARGRKTMAEGVAQCREARKGTKDGESG